MKKLEEFVIEKLKVTKGSGVPNLLSMLECTNIEEFNLQLRNLLEYLKDDSDLPIADLEEVQNDLKKLDTKYQNGNDIFLWINDRLMQYGTWDELYSVYWSRANNSIKNYNTGIVGFKDFLYYDVEIPYSKGIFIITKNKELMKQIDILKKKAEMFRQMRKLETYVNEKLRVAKSSFIPDLIAIVESKDRNEFNSRCELLSEYLKNDSDLPTAELKNLKKNFNLKQLSRKYENGADTFLWVHYPGSFFYGTWDDMYSMFHSKLKNGVKNYTTNIDGFKDFLCNDEEISNAGGIYIISENKELMKQINYLMQKAEPRV